MFAKPTLDLCRPMKGTYRVARAFQKYASVIPGKPDADMGCQIGPRVTGLQGTTALTTVVR